MKKDSSDNNLSRTMGLSAATAIGVGTMVGAGIFVFPGIAGGQAGPAAMLSFALGGLIALIVSACTAELSTAMPKSGGGYFFISRSFGAFWGTLVGVAQWLGLSFACAFYLAGFAEYSLELMEKLSLESDLAPIVFAMPATILLLLLNIVGTRNVGKFQNIIVISLTFLLVVIYAYGFLDVVGGNEEKRIFDTFFPKGKKAVLTTAALVFTSYLGFVQISTVAGEIKSPSKNLPRALIGSVLIVIVLYLFVLFVTTGILPVDTLEKLGEEATLEVAEELIGSWGVIIVLFSGLLATLSSANASMMSSSRSLFALSKDSLIPKAAGSINQKFHTPHIALIFVAVPIGILLFQSNLQLFAEVASFLHLVIYAGICIALYRLRSEKPAWFRPSFNVPMGKPLAVLGAISCISLIFFMDVKSIIIGFGIIILSGIYYFLFKKGSSLPQPEPVGPKGISLVERILIPIDVSGDNPAPIPGQLINILQASHVLILGYEIIPEQTDPEQADDDDLEVLNERVEHLMDGAQLASMDIDKEIVHTNDLAESITQTDEEYNCHAILTARPIQDLRRIVIPLYHPQQLTERLRSVLNKLKEARDSLEAAVFVIPGKKQELREAEEWKQHITERLGEVAIDTSYLEQKNNGKSTAEMISEKTADTDLVLLAESDISSRESFFDRIHRKIEKAVSGPLLVVLKNE